MKRYFLGLSANYRTKEIWRHTFAVGKESDRDALRKYLEKRYEGEAILCKNGRSGLALALKAYFNKGDLVIVNGFTCYAVYEAVKEAGLIPVFADISPDSLNYNDDTLKSALQRGGDSVKGIVVQNSLGNPVDIVAIEKFAKKHGLTIVEDLAHCVGVKYPDGREAGTVGVATAFSFGKEKSIDTVSGGAVVLREPRKHEIKVPELAPKPSDHLRARFYPFFGVLCRDLTGIHLGGVLMRTLIKLHWVEKSADNKLDLTRKISKFEAKLALSQFKHLKKSGELPLRDFYLVRNRNELIMKLAESGYYFSGFWYERPVSPERYYKKVHFPEEDCSNAIYVTNRIINMPTYYDKHALEPARKIIEDYLIPYDKSKKKEEK